MPRRRNRNHNRDERFQEVMHALREATHGTRTVFAEQLKQCPEAFKVGEILGKAIDSFKYGQDEPSADRLLPPPGAVIPPLV